MIENSGLLHFKAYRYTVKELWTPPDTFGQRDAHGAEENQSDALIKNQGRHQGGGGGAKLVKKVAFYMENMRLKQRFSISKDLFFSKYKKNAIFLLICYLGGSPLKMS